MHDTRIGRFFAVDPLARKYPHNSPYAFSENRVIDAIELEGLECKLTVTDPDYIDNISNSTNDHTNSEEIREGATQAWIYMAYQYGYTSYLELGGENEAGYEVYDPQGNLIAQGGGTTVFDSWESFNQRDPNATMTVDGGVGSGVNYDLGKINNAPNLSEPNFNKAIENVLLAADEFVNKNPGNSYGQSNTAKVPNDLVVGKKIDCAYFIDRCFINAGYRAPRNYKGDGSIGGFVEDVTVINGVTAVVNQLPIIDQANLQRGDLITFHTSRSDHKGPNGKFDHVGFVTNVVMRGNKVVGFDYVHSGGDNSAGTGGPFYSKRTYYFETSASPKFWFTGAYRPYYKQAPQNN